MYDSRIPFALHVCKTIVLPVTVTLNSKCRILRHIHPHICNSLEWGTKDDNRYYSLQALV